MARRRKWGEDLTYAEWHRQFLPHVYPRIGHRQDMADRDWTEFCHHCKEPVAVIEEVIDRGQDINDKATTVTRKLASRADVFAALVAPRIDRPTAVQQEIDQLNSRLRELESAYPIMRFAAKQLWPNRTPLRTYLPDEWAEQLLILHRSHHHICVAARRNGEYPVNEDRLWVAKGRSGIWVAGNDQQSLWASRGEVA
jgi:hypothetical protein